MTSTGMDQTGRGIQHRGWLLGLLALGIVVNILYASFEPVPGYMDAEYYYIGGVRLAERQGFTEMILWNYLDNPVGIPHPSHTYWMPLASILAAGGMVLGNSTDFISARILFILMAGFLPVVTAALAYTYRQKPRDALLAGLLAVFPGFYSVYTSNTETFSLYMILGAVFILLSSKYSGNLAGWKQFFLMGITAGLMHMSRADGLLWLVAGIGLIGWRMLEAKKLLLLSFTSLFLGYLVVAFPWYLRNLQVYGGLFSPGGFRTIWLTNYNQLFSFPADVITFQKWLSLGWGQHLADWINALWMNLKNALAVQGQVYLLPMIIAGMITLWKNEKVKLGLILWGITLAVMTMVFPFAGSRGGFLHSGSALQLFFFSLVPVGLDRLIQFGVRRRGWNLKMAINFFQIGLVVLSMLLTFYIYKMVVIGTSAGMPAWTDTANLYKNADRNLAGLGGGTGDIIMVNNPAGYFAVNRRPALVIPDGDVNTMENAARKYGAVYLLLEKNHVEGLDHLYQNPVSSSSLEYLGTLDQIEYFKFRF